MTTDNFALGAKFLHGRSYFHITTPHKNSYRITVKRISMDEMRESLLANSRRRTGAAGFMGVARLFEADLALVANGQV